MNKYELVEKWVTDALNTGKLAAGDMLPSERQLCEMFAVGKNSVRTALANLAHRGYVQTKKGIGTFCLASTRTTEATIGFVCFFSHSYIFSRIIAGCDRVLFRSGYQVLLHQSRFELPKEREILEKLAQRNVDGIIIEPVFAGSGPSNVDLLRELESHGTKIVLIDNHFPGEDLTAVVMDDVAGGELVAEHLVSLGHRQIGMTCDTTYYPKRLRRDGALRRLDQHGIQVPPEWMLSHAGPVITGGLLQRAREFFKMQRYLPTAFVCGSDEESIVLINAADESGLRVPEDFSVISFDNSSYAGLPRISLTSVDHPGDYIGDLAATLLLEKVKFPSTKSKSVIQIAPTLIERSSVQPAAIYAATEVPRLV